MTRASSLIAALLACSFSAEAYAAEPNGAGPPTTRRPPGAVGLPGGDNPFLPARDWSLAIKSTLGFDSNPSLTPDDDPREPDGGAFVQQQVFGSYTFWTSDPWSARVGGQAFVVYPTESPDFWAWAFRPYLDLRYRFQIGRAPAILSLAYDLDVTFLDGRSFNTGHGATAAVTVQPLPLVTVRSFYRAEAITFREGARNATRHTLGISAIVPVAAGTWGVATGTLGYAFAHNDARTGEFTHDRHSIAGTISVVLRPGLLSLVSWRRARASLTLGYSHAPYASSPVRPSRRDDAVFVRFVYRTPVWRGLAAELAIGHRAVDSSAAQFTTNRTTVAVSLVWRF